MTDRSRATAEQQARSDSDIRITALLTAPNPSRRRESEAAMLPSDWERVSENEFSVVALVSGEGSTEYRNEDGEITRNEAKADGWTDAGLEVNSRESDAADWKPWNYEAGYDYENNRYHEEAGR